MQFIFPYFSERLLQNPAFKEFDFQVQFNLPEDEEEKKNLENHEEADEDEEGEEVSSEEEKRKKKKKKSKLIQHPNKMTFSELKENKLLYTFFRKYVSQCESVEVSLNMAKKLLCFVVNRGYFLWQRKQISLSKKMSSIGV